MESSSASDRDTTSTLRAPPSPKWAHTSMSFFALMALGEAITGGAFATARIRSVGIRGAREAEEAYDALGDRRVRAADCDGAANPPGDLPPTLLPEETKKLARFSRQPVNRSTSLESETRSGHHTQATEPPGHIGRRERLFASSRGRRDTIMRIYTPAEVRPEPPPTRPREASPHPDGRAGPVVPKSGDADPARPGGGSGAVHARPIGITRLFRARARHCNYHETFRRAASRRAARVLGSERRTLTPRPLSRFAPSRPSAFRASASRFFSARAVRLRRTARPTTAGCRSTATCTTSRA